MLSRQNITRHLKTAPERRKAVCTNLAIAKRVKVLAKARNLGTWFLGGRVHFSSVTYLVFAKGICTKFRSVLVCVCVCVCVSKNDILHWVNTPTLDTCFGLVGHHQQGAECDPVESQPLNIVCVF